MPALINAFKTLFICSAELSPLENAIFDSVREKLQPTEAELWVNQLAAINKIHRSPDGKEVNLYVIRNGKSDFPKELYFGKAEEFKIAVVDVSANAGALTINGVRSN
jgi:hypothetical protein